MLEGALAKKIKYYTKQDRIGTCQRWLAKKHTCPCQRKEHDLQTASYRRESRSVLKQQPESRCQIVRHIAVMLLSCARQHVDQALL